MIVRALLEKYHVPRTIVVSIQLVIAQFIHVFIYVYHLINIFFYNTINFNYVMAITYSHTDSMWLNPFKKRLFASNNNMGCVNLWLDCT